MCPLPQGGASFVIYRDQKATVGAWGGDVSMSKQAVAVRQNMTLIVDGGQPVAGLDPYDMSVFGYTLGGVPNVWRVGPGGDGQRGARRCVRPRHVGHPVGGFARPRPGVRAMTLDINPLDGFRNLQTFSRCAGVPVNGSSLLPGTVQGRDLL